MIDELIGWYCKEALSCRFATIVFKHTISPESTSEVSISDAEDGSLIKDKLNGYNFVITDMYTYCTPGIVDVKVSPDDDNQKSFTMSSYEPARPRISPPVTVAVDVKVKYTNIETMSNDVFISFQGFWIPEDKMAEFSLLAEVLTEGMYKLQQMGGALISRTDETNELLRSLAGAQGVDVSAAGATPYYEPSAKLCRRKR